MKLNATKTEMVVMSSDKLYTFIKENRHDDRSYRPSYGGDHVSYVHLKRDENMHSKG